jgi:hypothetical protein
MDLHTQIDHNTVIVAIQAKEQQRNFRAIPHIRPNKHGRYLAENFIQ